MELEEQRQKKTKTSHTFLSQVWLHTTDNTRESFKQKVNKRTDNNEKTNSVVCLVSVVPAGDWGVPFLCIPEPAPWHLPETWPCALRHSWPGTRKTAKGREDGPNNASLVELIIHHHHFTVCETLRSRSQKQQQPDKSTHRGYGRGMLENLCQ